MVQSCSFRSRHSRRARVRIRCLIANCALNAACCSPTLLSSHSARSSCSFFAQSAAPFRPVCCTSGRFLTCSPRLRFFFVCRTSSVEGDAGAEKRSGSLFRHAAGTSGSQAIDRPRPEEDSSQQLDSSQQVLSESMVIEGICSRLLSSSALLSKSPRPHERYALFELGGVTRVFELEGLIWTYKSSRSAKNVLAQARLQSTSMFGGGEEEGELSKLA
mmetsp:Transcript_14676/g.34813  ORF Transcript_14676/g.34813 Transcript_14676/m.34813 type:complete len:217 (-) Transcript_14676:34-684(-)